MTVSLSISDAMVLCSALDSIFMKYINAMTWKVDVSDLSTVFSFYCVVGAGKYTCLCLYLCVCKFINRIIPTYKNSHGWPTGKEFVYTNLFDGNILHVMHVDPSLIL